MWILKPVKGEVRTINDRNICEIKSCMKKIAKVPLSNSFLERRDARRKFSESLGVGASRAPRTRQRISLGSENDWKLRLRGCQSWKASSLSLGVVVPTQINKYRMRSVGLGRDHLRSHFVFRPRHAPSDFVLDFSGSFFSQTKKSWPERFLPRPSTPQTLTHMWNSFSSELPL